MIFFFPAQTDGHRREGGSAQSGAPRTLDWLWNLILAVALGFLLAVLLAGCGPKRQPKRVPIEIHDCRVTARSPDGKVLACRCEEPIAVGEQVDGKTGEVRRIWQCGKAENGNGGR